MSYTSQVYYIILFKINGNVSNVCHFHKKKTANNLKSIYK